MNPVLKINPEYAKVIPPLSSDEYKELENNILADGIIISPLIVWNGVIIDGHNRFKIATEHPEISFTVFNKDFINEYEAIAWICKNQLGRRNLTKSRHKYLIGQRYEYEKLAYVRDENGRFAPSAQNEHSVEATKTCERIAKEVGVGQATVRRNGKYSKGVDIAEKISPGIREDILSHKISVPSKELEQLPSMTATEQESAVQQIILKAEGKTAEEMPKEVFEERIISSISGAVDMFKNTCDNYFSRYKRLLLEPQYKEKIILLFQDLKNYINHIEGE